jgi:HNH endonuclease
VFDRRVGSVMAERSRDADRKRAGGADRQAKYRLRERIFERDGYACRYCARADYPHDFLVMEHVNPRGGGDDSNLVTACRSCNGLKGDRTPAEAEMTLLPLVSRGSNASPDVTSDVTPGVRGRAEQSRPEEENGSSPSSSSLRSEDSVDAQVSPRRTESEWLAFIVERDPDRRSGKSGNPLGVPAERIARLIDYYEERFGTKFDARDSSRLAGLVKDTEGGYIAVMAAISEGAARDPKGDPLAYVQSILQRRNTHGAAREPARRDSARRGDSAIPDYDKLAADRLAREYGDAIPAA